MGWILFGEANHSNTQLMSKYAPDLAKHKFYVWLNNYHWLPTVILGAILGLVGGLPLVDWAICLRIVVGLHATWLVNSATHLWGYRRFRTKEGSTNLWWVALLTYGEGWHNNHHADPRAAIYARRWWELDPTWALIRMLEVLGLARDVHRPRRA